MSPNNLPAGLEEDDEQDTEFKGLGRRLGTIQDVDKAFKIKAEPAMDELLKGSAIGKTRDEAEDGSESVLVNADDISHSETPAHNFYVSSMQQPHNAGRPLIKKKVTGLRSEAKTLWQGPPKCTCCVNWTETPPANLPAAMKSSAEHGDYALLVRRTAHGKDRPWSIQSMTIYSPYILDMLRTTLAGYPAIALVLDQLALNAPFVPLLHRWNLIDEALKEEDELIPQKKNHFNLFRQIIEPELKPHLKARDECVAHGSIPFVSVWTIFKPGELVWWEADGQSVIGQMDEACFVRTPIGAEIYHITCEQLEWSGEKFGLQKVAQKIGSYDGTKPVMGLSAMPLRLRPDAAEIRNQHLDRGRKFEALRGYHFKAYEGPALGFDEGPVDLQLQSRKKIKDRIVIDANAYYQFQEVSPPNLLPLVPVKQVAPSPYHPPRLTSVNPHPQLDEIFLGQHHQRTEHYVPYQGHRDGQNRDPALNPQDLDPGPVEVQALTEDQLILCVPWVKSFVLTEKKWYQLAVDSVKDITWNDSFSNLVLPHQEKDLLLAFAQSKLDISANDPTVEVFDDFVDGKGKGVIMLLSGSPGVGKTLTAESIAEKMRVPLYTLSAGEIGIFPSTVEREIKAALEKCAKWNAILLLDEADVFLEKREHNSLKRNELVSIFLRLLEYYEGMMFLTTNRVSAIDSAFESRIDVSIHYPDLTAELRFQIWVKFVFRGGQIRSGVNLNEGDLRSLAQLNLNGRQIKSAVKTAHLLAMSKGEKLGITHLRAVLSLQNADF